MSIKPNHCDVGHDRTESVGNNETVTIGKDHSLSIGHDQELHVSHTQNYRIDQDKVGYVGNQILEEVYANRTYKTGGHYSHTVNGKMEVKAGERIKSVTKVYTVSGSDKITIKGSGGTIILDGSGVTLKGSVHIKGSLSITGGSGGGAEAINLRINQGKPFCLPCMLKHLMESSS